MAASIFKRATFGNPESKAPRAASKWSSADKTIRPVRKKKITLFMVGDIF
jgi:hypothetical protein